MDRFLRDAWYMAGWSEELGEALLARRIAGGNLVLYRAEDGGPVALDDRRPHRFAPLSRGRRQGDAIACGYHGLVFDRSGNVEDKPMIEAACANLEGADFWDQPPVSIGVDRGGIRARRRIQALLERESALGVAAQ